VQRIAAPKPGIVVPENASIAVHSDGTIVAKLRAHLDVDVMDAQLAELEVAVARLSTAMWRFEYELERDWPEYVDLGGEA
jgi:hypothetical protein